MKLDKVIIAGVAIVAILVIILFLGGACAACLFLGNVHKVVENSYTVEHREDKTVHAAAPNVDLEVNTLGGNIEIQDSTDGNIEVIYDVYASDGHLMDIMTGTNYSQDGDTLKIKAQTKLTHNNDLVIGNRGAHVYVKVPKNTSLNLSLKTLGGNIIVPAHSGNNVILNTLGGFIDLNGQYNMVRVNTAGGRIDADYGATDATFETLGGSINLIASQTSGSLKANTAGGDIHVRLPRDTQFKVDASTMGGQVKHSFIRMAPTTETSSHLVGPTEAGAGNLTVDLRTMGGNIEISY